MAAYHSTSRPALQLNRLPATATGVTALPDRDDATAAIAPIAVSCGTMSILPVNSASLAAHSSSIAWPSQTPTPGCAVKWAPRSWRLAPSATLQSWPAPRTTSSARHREFKCGFGVVTTVVPHIPKRGSALSDASVAPQKEMTELLSARRTDSCWNMALYVSRICSISLPASVICGG